MELISPTALVKKNVLAVQDYALLSARSIGNLFRRVNADRHRTYTRDLKFTELLLNASQLEVAERSPVAAIKDQQRRFRLRAAHGCGQ